MSNLVTGHDDGEALDHHGDKVRKSLMASVAHAVIKLDKIEKKDLEAEGATEATRRKIEKLTDRYRAIEAEAFANQRDYDNTPVRYSAEDHKRLISEPLKQVAAIKKTIKRLRESTQHKPTLTEAACYRALKPSVEYVDARVTVESSDPAGDLEAVREQITATAKEFSRAKERSHLDWDSKLRNLERQLESLRKKGEIKFKGCGARVISVDGRETAGKIGWPTAFDSSGTVILDGAAMVAFLFYDRLLELGIAELKATHNPDLAFTSEERRERLAELTARKLDLERREERLVELCEAAGLDVLRRPNANPLAVLGIAPATVDPFAEDDADADEDAEDFLG